MATERATDTSGDRPPVVLYLADFGGKPDSGEDAGPAMRRAIEAASRESGPAVLVCERGRYDFYARSATKKAYFISNTASETENPNPEKTIGIYIEGMRDFTLEGGDSLFVFHGKHTMFVVDGCERIAIRNLHADYAEPTVTEMTVEQVGGLDMDVRAHRDSRYEIEHGKLFWIGEGWRFREGPMQVCDPVRNTTWRIDNLNERATAVRELEPGRLRLSFDEPVDMAEGWVLQSRDGIRDQVGAFIHRSSGVSLDKVGVHFMHGLGIVGQSSADLSFRRLDLTPRPETGRTVAAFADFIHLSGCKGKISIADSRFAGAHDDVINVHGTFLEIVGLPAPDQVVVRFMHPQTYGFAAFDPGDEIEVVRSRSLTPYASGRVVGAELVSPREMRLTLEEPYPSGVEEGDVIENVSWTPEVEISGNHFARIPTRGVLVTTRRKAVVAKNVFERMRMSAILVANDAASWYESGRVENMTVRGNRFIECGNEELAVIAIAPENEEVSADAPVHRGIRIEANEFELGEARALDAKSARFIAFENNIVVASTGPTGYASLREAIRLTACTDVRIEDNEWR